MEAKCRFKELVEFYDSQTGINELASWISTGKLFDEIDESDTTSVAEHNLAVRFLSRLGVVGTEDEEVRRTFALKVARLIIEEAKEKSK